MADLARIGSDAFRLGKGVGCALFNDQASASDKAWAVVDDVGRGLTLTVAGFGARVAFRAAKGVGKAASRAARSAGKVASKARAPERIAQAVKAKGDKFFKKFKTGINQQTRQIGQFTEFATDVSGRVPGSFTRWVKVVDEKGRTIRLYHDTFDKTGKFIHRGIKVPGPKRHVR